MSDRLSSASRVAGVVALALIGGCDGSEVGQCAGQGTVLESGGSLYCVYSGSPAAVRDAPECSVDAPQRIVLRDSVVCAPAGATAGELPDAVCGAAGPGCGPTFMGPPVTWSLLDDFPGGPRGGMSAVFDRNARRVVTFGGYAYADQDFFYGDTWALDGDTGAWRELSIPDGPTERTLVGTAYDPTANRMVLAGGYDRAELSQVWALDLEIDRWSSLPSVPGVIDSGATTFDSGRIWVFGGSIDEGLVSDSLLGLSDGAAEWEDVAASGPPARRGAALAANRGSELLLVGGRNGAAFDGVSRRDIWRYSIAENRWTEVDATAGTPAPGYSGYVVDDACGTLILVGGLDGTDAHAAVRAVSLDTAEVVFLDPIPAPRHSAAVALDPVSRRLFVIGGEIVQEQHSASVYVGQLGACP